MKSQERHFMFNLMPNGFFPGVHLCISDHIDAIYSGFQICMQPLMLRNIFQKGIIESERHSDGGLLDECTVFFVILFFKLQELLPVFRCKYHYINLQRFHRI
jgi:hypothetical protein